jgi:hypothetical protein
MATALSMIAAFTASPLQAQRRTANASVNHNNNANRNVNANRNTNVNQNVNVNRNTNVNQNVNVNRNVNIDRDIDVNVHGGYGGYGCCYNPHPVATAAAVTTAAVMTAAVIGSVVNSVPPSCQVVVVGTVSYQQCGSTWYQPQFAGTAVTYIVVNPPR